MKRERGKKNFDADKLKRHIVRTHKKQALMHKQRNIGIWKKDDIPKIVEKPWKL